MQGTAITGDAVFCQRAICQAIRDRPGDDLFAVKANQPAPMSDLALAFGDTFPPDLIKAMGGATPPAHERTSPPDLIRSTRTFDKGHGRIETRQLAASHECAAHLGWPGVAQVCRIERTRTCTGKTSHEVAYAITSLSHEQADPDTLLELWRDHWLIENSLHWRRDVTLREDLNAVRSGASPRAMAIFRNPRLNVVRDTAEPLTDIRETLAENSLDAFAVAQKDSL